MPATHQAILRLLQIERIESLGKPAVDRSEKLASVSPLSAAYPADLRARTSVRSLWSTGFWSVNKDTVGIDVPSSLADADMTIFIQGVSYHLFGEYYPIPREAEGMRCYRLARDRTAMLIMTASPWVP